MATPRRNSVSPAFTFDRWAPWILCTAGLISYANSFSGTFVFDDRSQIQQHSFDDAFTAQIVTAGRPVGYLSFAINDALHGKEPAGYHAVNLAIHLLAGWLLFYGLRHVLRLAGNANAGGVAFVSALWWLVHPLQTQSVTYIIQRYESLAGMFYLACVVLFLKGIERRHWSWYLSSAGYCWLGILTKETLLTAPFVILAFDRVVGQESWRELALRRGWYYLLLLSSFSTVLWRLLDPVAVAEGNALSVPGLTPWKYASSQPGIILYYVKLAIWPSQLCLDYGWPVATKWWEIYPAGLVILGFLLLTAWLWWRRSYWSLLGIWFFFTLATTSSVLVIKDLAVEHRMYLALATVTTLGALGGNSLLEFLQRRWQWSDPVTQQAKITAIALIAVGLGITTLARNVDYHTYRGMWLDVIAKAPHNGRGYISLGAMYHFDGNNDEALPWLERGLAIEPRDIAGNMAMAFILIEKEERVSDAWPFIRRLQECPINKAKGHTLAGWALRLENKWTESEQAFKTAYELDPKCPLMHIEYARLFFAMDNFPETERWVMSGLKLEPRNAFGCNLRGILGALANQPADAEPWFRRAVELEPRNEEYQQNLAHVRRILASRGP